MTALSKSGHNVKLDEIVEKCNNTNHKTIRMKPADAKSGTYIDYGFEHNEKDAKFKDSDHVSMSK